MQSQRTRQKHLLAHGRRAHKLTGNCNRRIIHIAQSGPQPAHRSPQQLSLQRRQQRAKLLAGKRQLAGWRVHHRLRPCAVCSLLHHRMLAGKHHCRATENPTQARLRRLQHWQQLVAHNADDQAETVLLRLLRGAGLAGLRGMRPLSRVPGAPQLLLGRPLLTVPRAAVDAYCAQHGLQPRQDASNADQTIGRNRVRHEYGSRALRLRNARQKLVAHLARSHFN